MPLDKIPERQREVCLDLVYDRRRAGYDPLQELLGLFEGVVVGDAGEGGPQRLAGRGAAEAAHHRRRPRRARGRPRRGAGSTTPALAIVNDMLLAGMKVVGDLFGSGQMQLPFVLQSAETMKAAVAYLEPHMEKTRPGRQGPHRAGHGEGRRPRHRQEPGRHHPHQQRLRGAQPRHQGRRRRDGGQGRGGQGRRHRHERPAGEEHADHAREPRGAEPARAGPTSP